jgi:hypothetical protein
LVLASKQPTEESSSSRALEVEEVFKKPFAFGLITEAQAIVDASVCGFKYFFLHIIRMSKKLPLHHPSARG